MSDGRARILVVDDNTTDVGVLTGLLEDFELKIALDGESAITLLERRLPNVILLDIHMPGMNGFEVGGSDCFCARIGGDELALLIPGFEVPVVSQKAEQLRRDLQAVEISTPKGLLDFTVTIGLASLGERGTDSLDTLLASADDSLCQAKRWGRSQVYPSPDGPKDRH